MNSYSFFADYWYPQDMASEAPFKTDYFHIRNSLSSAYRNASPRKIERLVQEALGGVPAETVEDFLGTLAQIGQAALPIVAPAVGTVIGGPIGGVIGGMAGQAAAAGIKAATQPSPQVPSRPSAPPSPPRPQPAAPPSRPAPRPAVASRLAPTSPRPVSPGATPAMPAPSTSATGNTSAAQLLTLLLTPEFLQAIGSLVLGVAGNESVEVAGKPVPVAAFGNLLNVLSEQLMSDHHALQGGTGESTPSYLMDSEGNMKCDLAAPEERANVLWEMLSTHWQEDDVSEQVEDDPGEAWAYWQETNDLDQEEYTSVYEDIDD